MELIDEFGSESSAMLDLEDNGDSGELRLTYFESAIIGTSFALCSNRLSYGFGDCIGFRRKLAPSKRVDTLLGVDVGAV